MTPALRVKAYFLVAFASLGAGGMMAFFENGAVQNDQAKIDALRKQAPSEVSVQNELKQVSDDVSTTQAALEHLEQGVSAQAYVPTLLKELQNYGASKGLTILGVRPMPNKAAAPAKAAVSAKPYDELDIEVKGTGQYKAAMTFLQGLGNFPKIVAVEAVSMSPELDPSDPTIMKTMDVTIDLKAYVFKSGDGPTNGSGNGQSAQNSAATSAGSS